MYKESNQDKNEKFRQGGCGKGHKCQVCTGCGRCDISGKMSVITNTPLGGISADLRNSKGMRLVTVDIGTTTIAMQLHAMDGKVQDSYSKVNPQVKYGADVLSRIRAAQSREAARDMKEMAEQVLTEGLAHFRRQIGGGRNICMVIAANTTMTYLLKGWNPEELGHAPFLASHLEKTEIFIDGIRGYIFPGLSAFVGGDIVAGILSCGMTQREETALLIDLGTNGEMVLGNKHRLIACATAAGPAFEGGVNRGVWGADMISLLAELLRIGAVDETGLLADAYFEQGIWIGGVCVTEQAIRAIQLAKGAIRAGIQILAGKAGIAMEQIDKVVLAGGFGYYLKPADAVAIGLLPPELENKTVTGGNTALAGAFRWGADLIQDKEDRDWFWERKDLQIELLNLAEQADFQNIYVSSMELR